MAKKKAAGTSLVKWDAELAKLAGAATETEKNVGAGGNMIKLQGGRLQYQGAEIPENKMRVIILDHVLHNAWYKGKFNSAVPQSPECYAFARVEEDLAPHEKSPEPQNEQCKGCAMNEWGSADTGRGKACGNKRRLGLISESDLEDIMGAEVAYLHIPVTSVKGWAGYVRQLDELLKRPPLAVITEITVIPDNDTQFKVLFKMVEQIEDGDKIGELIEKAKTVAKEIMFPYPEFTAPAEPVKRGARGRNVTPARVPPKGKAAAKPSKFAR
jgi:hypothetical protein